MEVFAAGGKRYSLVPEESREGLVITLCNSSNEIYIIKNESGVSFSWITINDVYGQLHACSCCDRTSLGWIARSPG